MGSDGVSDISDGAGEGVGGMVNGAGLLQGREPLFIVALTARSYRDCHWLSVLGMVLYLYF